MSNSLQPSAPDAAVIGLGSMGFGMAQSLAQAGFAIKGYDAEARNLKRFADEGGAAAASPAEAAADKYHGVQKFDVVSGVQAKAPPGPPQYQNVFGETLGYTGPAGGSTDYTLKRESLVEVDGKFADAVTVLIRVGVLPEVVLEFFVGALGFGDTVPFHTDGHRAGLEIAVFGAEIVADDAVNDERAVHFAGCGENLASRQVAPLFGRDMPLVFSHL